MNFGIGRSLGVTIVAAITQSAWIAMQFIQIFGALSTMYARILIRLLNHNYFNVSVVCVIVVAAIR